MQAPMDSRDPAGELALTGLTLRRQLSLAEQVEVTLRHDSLYTCLQWTVGRFWAASGP